jgi:predicted RNA-binding protein with TRAM domain
MIPRGQSTPTARRWSDCNPGPQQRTRVSACDSRTSSLIGESEYSHGGCLTLEISDKLLCLFSAEVTADEDSYTVEIPKREVDTGSIQPGETYRVALIASELEESTAETETEAPPSEPQPPVEGGEIRYVEIEDIGKQGDGIARVERGYVIIVPGAEIGERVKVEITEVKSNFAVGEIIEEDV